MSEARKKISKKIIAHYVLLCVILTAGILLDQWSKHMAVVHLKGTSAKERIVIPKILQLAYVENRGAAWGILEGRHLYFLIVGIVILLVIGFVYVRIPHEKRYIPMRIVAVLVFMGAVGNMIDRARQGYVVDFFEFSFINFPVFNVADIYVVTGAAFLMVFGLFFYKDEDLQFFRRKKPVRDEKDGNA